MNVFAEDKINVTEQLKLVLGRTENIVGKGENAGYQHFLLFPQSFPECPSVGSLKDVIAWERVKGTNNSFCIKFLAFVCFHVFVNNTIMCQHFRQEIKHKGKFDIDKNIFILKPEPILS